MSALKQALLIPLFFIALAVSATPGITDGADPVGIALTLTDLPGLAGTELEFTIDDGPEPIPPLTGYSVIALCEDPDSTAVQCVSIEHKGTSIVVHVLMDDKAVEGGVCIVLGFGAAGEVGFVLELASITDGADPV